MDTQSLYNNVSYVCFDDSEYIYHALYMAHTNELPYIRQGFFSKMAYDHI